MRLFVGVYPPAPALDSLAGLVAGLRVGQPRPEGGSVRLAPRSRWHLTLAFLGDVDDDRLAGITAAAGRAVDAFRGDPPRLRLAGGGRFGRGRFTVLWAGVAGDTAGLAALATVVRRELKRARVPYDPKPYRPHLTLARPGDRLSAAELATDLTALGAYQGPAWPVEEIRVVRSDLGPDPVHQTLSSHPLPPP